jgi:cation diffusion facilitator family transporter
MSNMSTSDQVNTSGLKAGVSQRICVTHSDFLGVSHDRNERRTWAVVVVTALMMFGEIIGGTIYGSMALVADGWHMATHAAALSIAALAYRYARRHVTDPRFTFGTGKIGELTGFASAIVLGMISLLISWESLTRLVNPRAIDFSQATWIAVLGLIVNLVSAFLLHQGEHDHHHDDHDHDHDHDHDEPDDDNFGHAHQHHDNNLRAAYMHVIADALTSVLAIAGLLMGRYLGWVWMDPLMGIIGALVIAQWSWGLMRSAGTYLVDMNRDSELLIAVRARLEVDGDAVRDLHLWRIGPGHHALVVAIDSSHPEAPAIYRDKLASLSGLSHITVEVNQRI